MGHPEPRALDTHDRHWPHGGRPATRVPGKAGHSFGTLNMAREVVARDVARTRRGLVMTRAQPAEVASIVERYHYTGTMPAAPRHCFALRAPGGLLGDRGEVLAAAVYGVPVARGWPSDAVELARLVRQDDVAEALSEMLGWSLRWLRANRRYPFAISYADSGQGHHGGIYQATGWICVAVRRERQAGYRLPDGSVMHRRTVSKRLGTQAMDRVRTLRPEWEPVAGSPKYLYVRPLRQRRAAVLRRFNWAPKAHPKPDR